MATLDGAQLLVRSLLAGGESEIFSLSGNQVLPIYDVCLDPRGCVVDVRVFQVRPRRSAEGTARQSALTGLRY